MTLVAFVSARSPGLTTTVHALAAAWPAPRRAIVAELNPEGGSLAAHHEMPPGPGLTTLAAAGRRGLGPGAVTEHCRTIPSGPLALLGPMAPDQMASALAVLGTQLAAALEAVPGTDVLADCGRLHDGSPALPVVHSAAHVLMVLTPTLEGVAYAQSRLSLVDFRVGQVGLITVGTRPYPPAQVGAALQLPVVGAIAFDRRGTRDLQDGRPGRRSGLSRSARALAANLSTFLPSVGPEQPRPDRSASPPPSPAATATPPWKSATRSPLGPATAAWKGP